jgi:hypothetical protein
VTRSLPKYVIAAREGRSKSGYVRRHGDMVCAQAGLAPAQTS